MNTEKCHEDLEPAYYSIWKHLIGSGFIFQNENNPKQQRHCIKSMHE